MHPGTIPELRNAAGIASNPDPSEDLRRWKNAPVVLLKHKTNGYVIIERIQES